jgi:hypothetical protein
MAARPSAVITTGRSMSAGAAAAIAAIQASRVDASRARVEACLHVRGLAATDQLSRL